MELNREAALAVLERFCERKFEGEIPPIPEGEILHEVVGPMLEWPIESLAALIGRGLYQAAALDERQQFGFRAARDSFFWVLAKALGISELAVIAAINARQFPLSAPRDFESFEYLGKLTTDGVFVVADPCYAAKSPTDRFSLATHLTVEPGVWHAYARRVDLGYQVNTAELLVAHERGFDADASEKVGWVAVDAGMAGVFDRSIAKTRIEPSELLEGIVQGRGAVTSSGHGDGGYDVYAGRARSGEIAKLRIPFMGPHPPELDVSVHGKPAEARRYLATDRFAAGDVIDHKKFGQGTVIRVLPSDKIEVSFGPDEAPRTLVHGLKT